jgi:hypothetical protein
MIQNPGAAGCRMVATEWLTVVATGIVKMNTPYMRTAGPFCTVLLNVTAGPIAYSQKP